LPKAVGSLKKGCHNAKLADEEHRDCITSCGNDIIDKCLETCMPEGPKCEQICKTQGDDCYINKCGLETNKTNSLILYGNQNPKKAQQGPSNKSIETSKTSATPTKEDCEKKYGRPCRDVCNKKYQESKMKENRIKRGISEGKVTDDDRNKEETDFTACKKNCNDDLIKCSK
jgi:hypothetical protein